MNRGIACLCAVLASGLALGGCFLLPDPESGCDKSQPYESAQEAPPLSVPPGATAPDTREVLTIPEVRTPERPAERGRCLDYPPSYGGSRPSTG